MLEILFLNGERRGQSVQLGGDRREWLIGSSQECEVCVANYQGVSRRHARLFLDGQQEIWIEDLGSTNGTRTSTQEIKSRCRLKPTDQVFVGSKLVLQFRLLSPFPEYQGGNEKKSPSKAPSKYPSRPVSQILVWSLLSSVCSVAATLGVLMAYPHVFSSLQQKLSPALGLFSTLPWNKANSLSTELEVLQRTLPSESVESLVASPGTPMVLGKEFVWEEITHISRRFGDSPPSALDPEFLGKVESWIRFFTKNGMHKRLVARSVPYWNLIQKSLQQNGLPTELGYVVWVESGFENKAKSPVGALGLWQFMPATAREYGLEVSANRDERLDPEKATHAAAKYFQDLLKMFGSNQYLLALASYNAGQNGIKRRELKSKVSQKDVVDFWHLKDKLPAETLDYVPKILAAIIIGRNLKMF